MHIRRSADRRCGFLLRRPAVAPAWARSQPQVAMGEVRRRIRFGVAIGPSFRWQPWRCPYWWFRSSDLRAEHGGWAPRLVIKEASEMLFEPVQPRVVVILKAMEARGLRTDYAEKPAPWIKLR